MARTTSGRQHRLGPQACSVSENCSVPFFQVAFILNWTSKALKSFSPVGMNLSSFLNAQKERRKITDFIYNITDVKNESGG